MQKTTLLAGKQGVQNTIKWVTVIEVVEDIERIQQGEFLITTGYTLLENDLQMRTFKQLLQSHILSGVAIYSGFYLDTIPQTFIDIANAHHLPLIEIPMDINFSDITKEILEQLVNRQANILAQSEKTNRELTKLILNDQSLTEVTKRLAQLTNSAIVIYNEFYQAIYQNISYLTDDTLKINHTHITYRAQEIDISVQLLSSLNKESTAFISLGPYQIAIYPIVAKQACYGWILLCKEHHAWQDVDVIAIQRASPIYAMEFLKRQAIAAEKTRTQNNLLEDIIHGDDIAPHILYEQALSMHYDLSKQQCIFRITFHQNESQPVQLNEKLYQMIKNILLKQNKQSIIQLKLDAIIFLTHIHGTTNKEQENYAKQLANDIVLEWEFYLPKNNIVIGIGTNTVDLKLIKRSAIEANYAIQLRHLLAGEQKIIHYNDLGMYDFLIKMYEKGISLEDTFLKELTPIIHDNRREVDLMETVFTYFKYNQNIQNASKALYIHRHTLRYRLKQVEQKTNLSFKQPDDLLKLQLGVMVDKLLDILK